MLLNRFLIIIKALIAINNAVSQSHCFYQRLEMACRSPGGIAHSSPCQNRMGTALNATPNTNNNYIYAKSYGFQTPQHPTPNFLSTFHFNNTQKFATSARFHVNFIRMQQCDTLPADDGLAPNESRDGQSFHRPARQSPQLHVTEITRAARSTEIIDIRCIRTMLFGY